MGKKHFYKIREGGREGGREGNETGLNVSVVAGKINFNKNMQQCHCKTLASMLSTCPKIKHLCRATTDKFLIDSYNKTISMASGIESFNNKSFIR